MRKFNRGDLVEITNSDKGNEGYRYIIGNSEQRPNDECIMYESDIPSNLNVGRYKYCWTPEPWLKLIKPNKTR